MVESLWEFKGRGQGVANWVKGFSLESTVEKNDYSCKNIKANP